jgi:hypothetical protein
MRFSARRLRLATLPRRAYVGPFLTLGSVVKRFRRLMECPQEARLYVYFGEVPYLRCWQAHGKLLVDDQRN